MQIRRAVQGDLEQAAVLWRERAELVRQADPLPGPSPREAHWRVQACRWLDDETVAMFVAVDGGRLAGFISVALADSPPGSSQRMGQVLDAALDLHESHAGLAGDLLEAARSWLRSRGIDTLRVDVPAHYPVEAGFWLAQGARPRFAQHWLPL